MTGDEAYHADCFRCIQCDSKIDDLVFAKTSQGIYCMRCHQERKEAKRQREERERAERAERMMDKLLPTIPGEQHSHSQLPQPFYPPSSNYPVINTVGSYNTSSKPSTNYTPTSAHSQQQQHHFGDSPDPPGQLSADMPRLPFQKNLRPDHPSNSAPASPTINGAPKPNKIVPMPRTDSRPKPKTGLPSVDVGPPFLPPLIFGLDEASTSSFDLGDMLASSEKEKSSAAASATSTTTSSPPDTPSRSFSREIDTLQSLDINPSRPSTSKDSAQVNGSSTTVGGQSEGIRTSTESSESAPSARSTAMDMHHNGAEQNAVALAAAEAMIRELRMEVAKHNPMSPLLHGTPQQEYGLMMEKNKKLSQEHAELEKSIRDMCIEKDMLAMDLEAMAEELKSMEESLANGTAKLKVTPAQNPRMSTNHEFMKQAYLGEVKALQEQKERLQRDLQQFMNQREGILNEMQILSVRNAELSTINNDMMREMQGRMDQPKPPSIASGNGMLQSFTDKIMRQRQPSGGNQSELRGAHIMGSNESTHSVNSILSDENNTNTASSTKGRQNGEQHSVHKARREERGDDFYVEEMATPKKFNWKKGTTNAVKGVGAAMFGKRTAVDNQNSGLEVPSSRGHGSDASSANGLTLTATRTYSHNSETRSLSGKSTEHIFVLHNFVRPTRCDCCEDKLWGREYRCRLCGFHAHSRCTHDAMPVCSGPNKDSDSSSFRDAIPPAPPSKQVMFGTDLIEQLELEQRTIPMVVEKCIEAVDERGLDVEGIYRRSGMAAEARQLVQAYDVGLQPDLMDDEVYQDICSITSVLKQYLRSLPQPLIPYDLYSEFINTVSLPESDAKLPTFRSVMDRMPTAHYVTLRVLMEHLNRVTSRDKINLMNAKNLSVVFGPTLMRNPDATKEIMDMAYKNMTIEFFINHTNELFVRDDRSVGGSSTTGSIHSGTGRPSTSSSHERPSTSSSHERPSTSSNHERPMPNNNNPVTRKGSNGHAAHLSPPPRRTPLTVANPA
ncbi:hypothetical protein BGZ98_007439, partial [Dissophora globulifera]